MPIRKAKAKAKKRTPARKSSGLAGFQRAMKAATKTTDARIKKTESALLKLKKEKAAKKKKALIAYRKKSK